MARTLAANFLSQETDAVPETETAEVIRELANMLCGSVLSTGCKNEFALLYPMPFLESHTPSSSSDALRTTLKTDLGTIYTSMSFDRAVITEEFRGDE